MKSNLEYSGKVLLTRLVGDKKISTQVHNAGTDDLLGFFASCLLGHLDVSLLPSKVRFYNDTTIASSDIVKSSSSSPSRNIAQFDFMVLPTYFEQSSVNKIVLLATNNTILAEVSFPSITIKSQDAWLVQWQLSVQNEAGGNS